MPEETWLNDYVFTVDNLLTARQCEEYIQLSEDLGYDEATVTSPQGDVVYKDLRNNQRVLLKSEEMAAALWLLAADFVPHEWAGRSAVGVNELLRFYRYDVGQYFNWHIDHPYERESGEQSCLTYIIYLNDDFEGGETSFEDSYSDEPFDEFQVAPQQGMGLFFVHATSHKGEPVTSGRKYVLRTDIMYSPDELDAAGGCDLEDVW